MKIDMIANDITAEDIEALNIDTRNLNAINIDAEDIDAEDIDNSQFIKQEKCDACGQVRRGKEQDKLSEKLK